MESGANAQRRKKYPLGFRWCAAAVCMMSFLGAASAQSPQQVRFVTFNVDFNNSAAQIDSDINLVKPKADVILFQEAKWVTIADSFPGGNWTIHQVTDQGDAKRGSGIALRNSAISQVLATGLELGVSAAGYAMLDRYIAWADVEFNNGLVIRVMSLHMPPQRFQELQPVMATNLKNFIAATPYPVVVGGDWNYTVNNDPYNIEGPTGLTASGQGIDGFYYPANVADFISISKLSGLGVNSDHHPVQLKSDVHVPTYIVDNSQSAKFSASSSWSTGTSAADKYGSNYRFRNTGAVSDPAQWTTSVTAGRYNVYAWWSQGANRSATAPYVLPDNTSVSVSQQTNGGQWNLLGTQTLSGSVVTKLSCWTTAGYVVIADAIKYGP